MPPRQTIAVNRYGECKAMADRIIEARTALRGHLEDSGSSHSWSHSKWWWWWWWWFGCVFILFLMMI
jgi:hypothetical protein